MSKTTDSVNYDFKEKVVERPLRIFKNKSKYIVFKDKVKK